MELMKKTDGGRWFTGKYHDGRMTDKVANRIRLAVVVAVFLVLARFDHSNYLVQLSKWSRRAVLLFAGLAAMELFSFIVIRAFQAFLYRNPKGENPRTGAGG